MQTTPSPTAFHTGQNQAFFLAMQRQIHVLAAQLRALHQPDPLRQMQRQHARALRALQQQFGDSAQIAAQCPPVRCR